MSTQVSVGEPASALVPPLEWGRLNSHGHSVQFYADDDFLLAGLSRYIGSALGAGDVGIVIATPEHREDLARRLRSSGLDVGHAVAHGRFVSLDATETLGQFMVNGWPDAGRFNRLVGGVIQDAASATRSQTTPVAVFGEMVALLWSEGKPDAAIRLEQLWNELARTHSFRLHCAYPMNFFTRDGDDAPIGRICAEHSHVVPAESYTTLASEAERLQAITVWQQKAQALANEVEERRRIQQELSERNEELRKAIAVRDEFLSVAAHELKTPLTSLRAYSQLLLRAMERRQEIAPERIATALAAVEQQTGKLNQLVTRLLDTAQIEAGKLRIEPVPVDLVALVRAALAQRCVEDGNRIVFESPEQVEARVDPIRFEQVITNLLNNAVKFSPKGGVVLVDLRRTEDNQARLSVTDQGIGIPAEERDLVFDRFQQANGVRHLSGLGLGLYITREIVELHHGSIWIEQPNHPGTRFVVTVPLTGSGV